jgi:hypothetical protein
MAQRYPLTISREFTNAGIVGAGFKKYFYVTGTSTLTTTYSNNALTIANTNPVIADANGRFAEMFVSDWSLVKEVLKDASDNIINGATVDPVSPSGLSTVTLNDLGVRPTSYWGLTAGTATAYTLVANPTISAYANTQTFFFQPHVANSAAPTMAIDGLAALNLKKYSGQGTKVALQAGDLQATERYEAVNDGVDIIILNPRNQNTYLGTNAALTIATGVVTITNGGSLYALDTESAAATDDLDTINGGNDGQEIFVTNTADARNVVLKHNTGNIFNPNLSDVTLDVTSDRIKLLYNSTLGKWLITSQANRLGFLNSKAANGYTYLPNGTLMQWGTGTVVAGTLLVTFPITFPTVLCHFGGRVEGSAPANRFITGTRVSLSQVNFYIYDAGGSASSNSFTWYAIGY